MAFFQSKPEKFQRVSSLRPGQEDLFSQLQGSIAGPGAGGAYGDVADYFRELLGGGGSEAFEAPLQRQFNEDTIPGLAEQFAGMGSGALSSSGFMQEAGRASTDLAERLGAIRAGLRQQGAQGLFGLAQGGMQPVDEMVFRPRQPGLLEQFASSFIPSAAKGVGTALGAGALDFLKI